MSTSEETGNGHSAYIYRQDDLLVADMKQARFPFRCVVTNEKTIGKPRFNFRSRIMRQYAGAYIGVCALFIAGFALTAGYTRAAPLLLLLVVVVLAQIKTLKLRISLREELQNLCRQQASRWRWMFYGGNLLAWVVPLAVIIPDLLFRIDLGPWGNMGGPVLPNLILGSIGLGVLLIFVSMFYAANVMKPALRVRRAVHPHVWLTGAGPEFLESLPQFDPAAPKS
ncbi:hypothetical protein [Lignipirellula cremea]|uniref:Uncharacterized protein n=1 Tax=Lignipirellula cremea TaxID=2528010 RepID=A0A518E319_9BACT|nr:hypothetical protein [Lignipirellula cremea]QDU98486.1 hypothetical protein Pla8534_63550 [Lignipirellula cremea]